MGAVFRLMGSGSSLLWVATGGRSERNASCLLPSAS